VEITGECGNLLPLRAIDYGSYLLDPWEEETRACKLQKVRDLRAESPSVHPGENDCISFWLSCPATRYLKALETATSQRMSCSLLHLALGSKKKVILGV
jgi:hypothetical protein